MFKEKNKCLNNCYNLKLYEYNGICYNNSCPNGTRSSNNNSYICEIYTEKREEYTEIDDTIVTTIISTDLTNLSDNIDLYNLSYQIN